MDLSILITASLVFSRVTGLVISMPGLNLKIMPKMAKVLMIFTITLVLAPVMPPLSVDLELTVLIVSLGAEMILGVIMGSMVNLIFSGLALGTSIISTQIGQAAALQFNPSMQVSQGPLGSIAVLLSIAIFLGDSLHLEMLIILANSFQQIPPAEVSSPISAMVIWVEYSEVVIIAGVRMAGPILALVFLNNSFLAVLSRIAPSMNVFFSVGFMVSMIGGVIIFTIMIPNLLDFHIDLVRTTILKMPDIIDLAGDSGG